MAARKQTSGGSKPPPRGTDSSANDDDDVDDEGWFDEDERTTTARGSAAAKAPSKGGIKAAAKAASKPPPAKQPSKAPPKPTPALKPRPSKVMGAVSASGRLFPAASSGSSTTTTKNAAPPPAAAPPKRRKSIEMPAPRASKRDTSAEKRDRSTIPVEVEWLEVVEEKESLDIDVEFADDEYADDPDDRTDAFDAPVRPLVRHRPGPPPIPGPPPLPRHTDETPARAPRPTRRSSIPPPNKRR